MSFWEGKVAIVTGASAGFGAALASELIKANTHVAVADIDSQPLEDAAEHWAEQGGSVLAVPTDVTEPAQVQSLVEKVVERFGRLDLMANIVGRSSRGLLLDTPPDEFLNMFRLNFLSVVHGAQAAAPHLIQTGGHLVNMGSLAAKSAARFLGAYPASKFPVAAFSQQLHYELSPKGVHVLLVCPGPLARPDAGTRYDDQAADLPESARRPGGGVRVKGIPPERLARQVLHACQRRKRELVIPWKARCLFALLQLFPSLGDRILLSMTRGS